VRRQVAAVCEDLNVDAFKTGMLPTSDIITETSRLISEFGLRNIVIDPVVRSTSGFDLIDDVALDALIKDLFPLADIITPNLQEAERIAKMPIVSEADVADAGRVIMSMGARRVLIKGGHRSDARKIARDDLFSESGVEVFESEYIETTSTHGTGCTLASGIAAGLALGNDMSASVRNAKAFVTAAIRSAPKIGRGNSPVDHLVKNW
jgi:hydroxymethylpyrimidine kinase/phosphomethylpyrimidine kinase